MNAKRQYAPRNVANTPKPSATMPPCTRLKRLRERAKVTAKECAIAYKRSKGEDGKDASPNNWYRYEAVDRMGDSVIPDHVISAVMPLLVGRGMPPVTADELLSISSAHRLLKLRNQTSLGQPEGRILPQPMVAPVFEAETGTPLVVRYRAERGVFMDTEALHKRTFGTAPITAAKDIKGDQFCVLIADGPTAGTVLQCVEPSAYSNSQLNGRRVVLVTEHEKLGLSEVGIGLVQYVGGNKVKIVDAAGKEINGSIYGVVVGSYARE